jgi:hypothetical protein
MANTWGALSWNSGNWGDQNNVTLSVTGIQLNSATNSVDAFNTTGWGSDSWGLENWGESGITFSVTGLGLEIDLGAREAWGQLAWNASDTEWGGPFVPQVAIGQQINISGQQLNISQGEESITSATEIFLSDNPLQGLTIAEGTIDPAPDALVTGQQLNFNVGSVTAFNEQGWGRDDWGTEVWGAQGIWTSVSLTGFDLSVTSGIQETWGQDEWGATTTEWGGSSVTDVDILTIASPTGIELTAAEGTVDPSPDATVIGIGLTMGLGLGSVSGNADVVETGEQVNITLGTATLEAVTFANVTGQQLNFNVGTAVAGASAEVDLTGNQLNIALGNEVSQIWTIVDTGSTVSYTEVSTGTSVTWNEVDTAA